ncbi:MAG TPA: hypothetical protein VGO59_18380 [Verrucomicrobiae bacterium]|jgi:hypothetical protein
MRSRFAVILALLNVAALAAGFAFFRQYWGRQTAQDRKADEIELAAWKAKAAAAPGTPTRTRTEIVYKTNDFRWSQLESTDYRQYIANLRSIGCPESTIKDIILTDVMRLYAQRRGQYYHNGRAFKYWETNDKRKLKQPQIEERDKQLAQIDKELPAVLRELLGVNYERELNKYFVDTDDDDDRLAFLSDDKRAQVLSLRDQFEGKREQVRYGEADGKPSAEEAEQLRQIDQWREDQLSQLLSPAEKEQYELSTSSSADWLRQQLVGFSPTEEEFRGLYEKQKAIDESYEFQDPSDPAAAAAKSADEAQMMTDFKSALAGNRVGQFERSQDPDYQSLTLLSERYDLRSDAADTLTDMKQAVEEARQKLLSNKDIPPDKMQIALDAMQAETDKAVRETLGDKAYEQYAQSANWFKNAGTN